MLCNNPREGANKNQHTTENRAESIGAVFGNIHSVETFGTVDGPGVRLVVFFQGCPMRCAYCHNPDTWNVNGGTKMTADEILNTFNKNKNYYKNGGITATGGEPMLQPLFLENLFKKAKAQNIHTCLDTSGIQFNPSRPHAFDAVLQNTDLVMLDIKHIDPESHKKLCKQENTSPLAFAKYLSDIGKDMWIRHVVVPNVTDKEEDLFALGEFIGGLKHVKALDVLPYHTMGIPKYEALGIDYPLKVVPPLDESSAVRARNTILRGIKSVRKR